MTWWGSLVRVQSRLPTNSGPGDIPGTFPKAQARGLVAGTEALAPICPQHLADLISWYAIGARTTASQTHREVANGLSAPVGFKNGTDGGLEVAVNAIQSAKRPYGFLGVNEAGRTAVLRSRGNGYGYLVLHDVVPQIPEGNRAIVGLMLESNLFAGNQPIPEDLSKLRYGVSVTDACIDWPTTE